MRSVAVGYIAIMFINVLEAHRFVWVGHLQELVDSCDNYSWTALVLSLLAHPNTVFKYNFLKMAARDNAFDMQIKLLMIGDSGACFISFVWSNTFR